MWQVGSSSEWQVFVVQCFVPPLRDIISVLQIFLVVRCMESVSYMYLGLYKIPGITAHQGNPAKGAMHLSSSAIILNIFRV